MAAFAARRPSRIRLGQMCTCMGYRNPAYLAKVAATVDIISGGRVEMGIGAGWYEHEWRAYGYGFPRPVSGWARSTRACRSCGRPGRRHGHPRRQALSGRRRDLRPTAAAGGRHPAVDRRRRREGDAAHRGEVRAVHELHRQPEGFAHKSRGAGRALPRPGHRLRRDHPFGELQRRRSATTEAEVKERRQPVSRQTGRQGQRGRVAGMLAMVTAHLIPLAALRNRWSRSSNGCVSSDASTRSVTSPRRPTTVGH